MCSGVHQDPFSSDGQNWGFPIYNWDYMAATDYEWWRLRFSRMPELSYT